MVTVHFLDWMRANADRFPAAPVEVTTEPVVILVGDFTIKMDRDQIRVGSPAASTTFEFPSSVKGASYTCGLIEPAHCFLHATVEDAWVQRYERLLGWMGLHLPAG